MFKTKQTQQDEDGRRQKLRRPQIDVPHFYQEEVELTSELRPAEAEKFKQ